MIQFDVNVCGDLQAACEREWLETNGLGSFASSTIIGLNTRRYHGLLVAATHPPVGRMVLLAKLDETLIVDANRYDLSCNQYPGAVHPQGHMSLQSFRLDPFPIFCYAAAGFELEKSVFMVQGKDITVVQYKVLKRAGAVDFLRLEVRALVAYRDYHSLTHENPALNREVVVNPGLASITPYQGVPTLHLAHNAEQYDVNGCWYRSFIYAKEGQRGLDDREDLWSPCVLRFDLKSPAGATILAATEVRSISDAARFRQQEITRRQAIVKAKKSKQTLVEPLLLASEQFIVARDTHKTVIAGYPWFGDWGRDTMIALPGLTLVTGRFDTARSILLEFSRFMDQGMLPNRFPDAGEAPEYNTVDATLWYFHAISAYLKYTGDLEFVRDKLYPVLLDSIEWHVRGTRYQIKMEEQSGLLHAGEPGVQLTWMDAKIGDWVVTPRIGMPVEIQALWHNALRTMQSLAQQCGTKTASKRFAGMAEKAAASFNKLFWNEAAGCLYDVVNGDAKDAALRPNQILAVSLPHSILEPEKARSVVDAVERELLTPLGLRTLSAKDPAYQGRYQGDQRSRDAAYHQGTVWPWLLGPFITAFVKVHGNDARARQQAAAMLPPFLQHLQEAGLGQVSEIFDGDPPHTPRGCIAQAWSVAELLRAALEDLSED